MELHNILKENQAGFRKGYSTCDNIFTLNSIITYRFNKRKKLYCYFVDFSSAFDGIDRQALFYKLSMIGLSYKFVNMIRGMYENTTAVVWNGQGFSSVFVTESGVKQGCLFSPHGFNLYINDLVDYIGGGLNFDGQRINALLYADDVVLIADTPEMLQSMIKKLENYCNLWKLVINRNKSKIMVFRNGGRLGRKERWYMGGEEIEIVNSYKYLGVLFSTKLSFSSHFEDKASLAMLSINTTWNNLLKKPNIDLSVKLSVFNAVMRSILCYAAEMWGFMEADQIERVLRTFIKRLFGLPSNTPTYMILLEFKVYPIFIFTFRLHIDYIIKVAENYESTRFPKIMLNRELLDKTFWYKEWQQLADKYDFTLALPEERSEWRRYMAAFQQHIIEKKLEELVCRANCSAFHDLYCKLDVNLQNSYIYLHKGNNFIRLVFLARGGLLPLNARSWTKSTDSSCWLCNMDAVENTSHFIGKCPIYRDLRVKYFGKSSMEEDEVIVWLNGKHWDQLYKYLCDALTRRRVLIFEMS